MPISAAKALCLLGVLLVAAQTAEASRPWWMRGIESNDTDFLPPDVAFRVGAQLDGRAVVVRWVIADGYYLYRQKIEIHAESPDLVVSAPTLPRGHIKTDPYLGTQEILTQQVEARVAYARLDRGAHPMQIKVVYQGCAEAGLCYPPITRVLFPAEGGGAQGLPEAPGRPNAAEITGMLGGVVAFLCAGFALRRQRRLEPPPA